VRIQEEKGLFWFLGVIIVILLLGCASIHVKESQIGSKPVSSLIEDALQKADREGKLVLLYFWGAWCSYCEQLDRVLAIEDVHQILDSYYVQVRVDVGEFDKNMDTFNLYMGKDARGIPALAILRKDGTIKVAITGEKWGESDQEVYDYVKPFLEKIAAD